MDALKKCRSSYAGAITRIWNKFVKLLDEDPDNLNQGQLEHQTDSIRSTDQSYRRAHAEISAMEKETWVLKKNRCSRPIRGVCGENTFSHQATD